MRGKICIGFCVTGQGVVSYVSEYSVIVQGAVRYVEDYIVTGQAAF